MKSVPVPYARLLTIVGAMLMPVMTVAQPARYDSLWQPLKVFIGSWQGKGGGEPGTGEYVRTYRFVLDNRYIEVRNKSTYPPTDKKAGVEVHEDRGYISYDRNRRTFVLRQFHSEGFVNQYVLDSISEDARRIVFISENIENIAPGWRAKETYVVLSENQLQETFELAAPGKPYSVYTSVVLNRQP